MKMKIKMKDYLQTKLFMHYYLLTTYGKKFICIQNWYVIAENAVIIVENITRKSLCDFA
jgi:hypothetical protein